MKYAHKVVREENEEYSYHGGMLGNTFSGRGHIKYKKPTIENNTVEYDGEWHRGQMHGQGRQVLLEVGEYRGSFKLGLKDGVGTFEHVDHVAEEIYVGEFAKDRANGRGYLRW